MNQIKVGSIISYIQIACSVVITLFYTPVMIELLGKSEYGLYNTVSSVISLNLGFGSSYIKYYSELKKREDFEGIKRLNGMFFCVFSFISLIVFFCSVVLVDNLDIVFSFGLTESEYIIAKKLFIVLIVNLAFCNICTTIQEFLPLFSAFCPHHIQYCVKCLLLKYL